MRLRIELTGTTPLLMHHPQLADPANQFAQQIKEITAKGSKQTEKDRADVKRREWFGGLYLAPANYKIGDTTITGPIIPTANIRKAIHEGAIALKTRQGEDALRAISFTDLFVLLNYDGPHDLDELFADPQFTFETSVNPNPSSAKKGRVQRVRPCFPRWAVTADLELVIEVLSFENFHKILNSAGQTVGLMDGRRIGHGRFTAEIKKLSL